MTKADPLVLLLLLMLTMILGCDDDLIHRSVPIDFTVVDSDLYTQRQDQELLASSMDAIDQFFIDEEQASELDLSIETDIPFEQMSTPCPISHIRDQVVPIEFLNQGTYQLDLLSCEIPMLRFALAKGSRWSLVIKLSVNHDEGEQSASLIEALSEELSSTYVKIFNTREWASRHRLSSDDIDSSADELLTRGAPREWNLVLDLLPTQNGRHTLVLERGDLRDFELSERAHITLTVSFTCQSNCQLESTHHPIVLVHGYAGVDQYFGLLDYFYRVPTTLRDKGFEVLIPSLDPIELTEVRAEQLLSFLREAQLEGGYGQFNLIAHSQGGLDSRYLISRLNAASLVTTLTTIATPHRGIPLQLIDFFSRQDFSEETLIRFNQETPDAPDVKYFSWSARTCSALEWRCLNEHQGELVTPFLLPTYTLLRVRGHNDGLVPTASMSFGEHLGVLSADHFDQIGQIADSPNRSFDHLNFYLSEAERLRRLGF